MTKEAARRGGGGADGEEKRKKLTQGRQRIPMQIIVNKDALQVCFSKRRSGVLKKAFELSVICGVQLAFVVFSPAGKAYSFGHPSVPVVIERFLNPSPHVAEEAAAAAAVHPLVDVEECNRQVDYLKGALEAETRRGKALDEAARAAGVWTDDDVRRAELPALEAMLAALERVQAEAAERYHEAVAAEQAMMMMMQCTGGAGSHETMAMDMKMMLMGGDVGHALAPMMPHHSLLPPPFNHDFGYNNFGAGYGYNLDDGHGHGAVYETEGSYWTTCNFLGLE